MVTLNEPLLLLLLPLGIPIFLIMKYRYSNIRKNLLKIYTEKYVARTHYSKIITIKLTLLVMLYIVIVVTKSGPELVFPSDTEHIEEQPIVIVMDLSMSMYAKEDNNGTRMDKVIDFLMGVINNNKNNRIMLIGFTDTMVQLSPFTDNYSFINDVLFSVKDTPPIKGGTDFPKIIPDVILLLDREISQEDFSHTRLIFISDGETHEKVPDNLLKELAKKVSQLDIISVGTEDGSLLDLNDDSNTTNEVNVVISYANPSLMKLLSEKANANYIDLESSGDIKKFTGLTSKEASINISWIGWFISFLLMFFYTLTLLV